MYRRMMVFLIAAFVFTASAQSISISLKGKVTSTKGGKAIAGAIITIKALKISDTTDNQGSYSIITSVPVLSSPILPITEKISLNNGFITVSLTKSEPVKIEMFDMKGILLERALDRPASAGDYRFDLTTHPLAANMMVIRVAIGNRVSSLRYLPPTSGNRTIAAAVAAGSTTKRLAKIQNTVDTLNVTASGFLQKGVELSSYQQTLNITLDSLSLGKFSFFVTSLAGLQALSKSQNGFGGDLRMGKTGQGAGLLGADSICQCLAETSMPGSKAKIWRAYLSAKIGTDGKKVNAIDRIGQGPWYDRIGRLVAKNTQELQQSRPASADTAIKNDLPNEYGVPNHRPDPNQPAVDNHLTVTGSDSLGHLYSDTSTCEDWTSATSTTSKPRSGVSWPRTGFIFGGGGFGKRGMFPIDMGNMLSWVSFWDLPGCVAGIDLKENTGAGTPGAVIIGSGGGYGGFYCFALNP